MVEKQIEFYFSKHPHKELDCGWSRKGSSYYRKEPIMAKFNHTSEGMITASFEDKHVHVVCNMTSLIPATPLWIERAFTHGAETVKVSFEYVNPDAPDFDPYNWAPNVLRFGEFETLMDFLIREFNCIQLVDEKPLAYKPYWHTGYALFRRKENEV